MDSWSLYSSADGAEASDKQSRLRSHKGNVPTLPQTKECWLCPGKFTRTTHLNRHLKSHANERLYRCEICPAEFTRSDLLARHKKSCGESRLKSSKSRQKSCQACAGSKIKCNLQWPCQKCVSRGRECIFLNDPEVSRQKKSVRERDPSVSPTMSVSAGEVDLYTSSPTASRDGSLPSDLLFSSPESLPSTAFYGQWPPASSASPQPPGYPSEFEFGTPTPLDTVFDIGDHQFISSYSDPYIHSRPVDPSALQWKAQNSWHGFETVPHASLTCHYPLAGTCRSAWTGPCSEAYT